MKFYGTAPSAFAIFTGVTAYTETLTGTNLLGDHAGFPGNATYDYVVVGGGTAGLTMATRLAANGTSVAIVEAGGFYERDNSNYSSIPAMAGHYIGTDPISTNPSIDWQYQAEPLPSLGNRSIFYNSGKTLGGASAHNSMVYARASYGSYHKWSEEVNDSSFELHNFLKYYQRSVTFDTPNQQLSRLPNATGGECPPGIGDHKGPVHVTLPAWANAVGTFAAMALRSLGLRDFAGVVNGSLIGYGFTTSTIDGHTQTRSSAETAYLRYALLSEYDIMVYTGSLAEKILFNSDQEATHVTVSKEGATYNLTARKEIVLSAGAFRSPQLLMLSGVGPRLTLEALGIGVVAEHDGVGQGLQDQLFFGPSYSVSLTTHSRLADKEYLAEQTALYRTKRTGMLTNPGFDFIAWEKLPTKLRQSLTNETHAWLDTFPSDWPEIQTTFGDAFSGYVKDKSSANYNGQPQDTRNYISILPALVATSSRGNITINTTSAADNSVVYPALLSDSRDRELAVAAAFKRARQFAATPAMQQIILGGEVWPGSNVSTDAQILDLIQQSATPLWHASCTCKMGTDDDHMAVVDTHGRVKGVKSLRVVDASIFPFLVPCHPSATVYALAEKIAEQMLNGE